MPSITEIINSVKSKHTEKAKEGVLAIAQTAPAEPLNHLLKFGYLALINDLQSRFADCTDWQILGVVEGELFEDDSDPELEIQKYVYEKNSDGSFNKSRKYYLNLEDEDALFTYDYIWQELGLVDNTYHGICLVHVFFGNYIKIAFHTK